MDSAVVEDYLKAIWAHTEWQPRPMTSGELAARLGLAPSSVSEMLKKLVAQGLVEHEPYGAIHLTAAGRSAALRMLRRHRLIETWLVERFGYGWDEVHDEAEVLEHAVSDRLLEAMDRQLGHPRHDPHGDPIPPADGEPPTPQGRPLAEAGAGVVIRIRDHDPAQLRELAARGVGIGSRVSAAELGEHLTSAVWVRLD